MSTSRSIAADRSGNRSGLLGLLVRGFAAGLLAGLFMLIVMALLRMLFGAASPMEMIFDRLFPKLTVQFFIDSLVRAGGYTPLKLQGIFGALAGHLGVTGAGGAAYAFYLGRLAPAPNPEHAGRWADRRGWLLAVPGVLAVWALFVVLLWPQLLTSYRGAPPGWATACNASAMLLSFASCGVALIVFHLWLTADRTPIQAAPGAPAVRPALLGRREFLAGGVGLGLAVVLGGLLRRFFDIGTFSYDGREYLGPKVRKITPIRPDDEFYQVSKNFVDPDVTRSRWRLGIGGEVDFPRTYTFADIEAMPAVEQETTLLCISYRVGGGLCSNALWKGVPLRDLLAGARPKGNVAAILFHAADGYYETFPYAKAMEATTLLAYGMNGEPLPQRHGFPLRLIVPGLYGEKNPKWITRIELLNAEDGRLHQRHGYGFYKEQGWGPNFAIPTTSRIDAPQVTGDHFEKPFPADQKTEVRGMAFGGDRGITKVEVSTDDGKTWAEARITQPGTKISWSLWRYDWTPEKDGGEDAHFVVRATDGDGKLQIAENRNTVPQGATGLHRVRAKIA